MRDAPGQGLRITGAQPQRGFGDQFDVLGVGLGQIQGARSGVATGLDGAAALTAMPSSYSSAARLLVSRLSAALAVP